MSQFKYVVLPTIGLILLGTIVVTLSGLINTGLLMGLSHSLVNKTYNTTRQIECDPLNILCETSNQMISFYNGNEFSFLFGWAMALVFIEMVKFIIIIAITYGLYTLFLRQYVVDLVNLFPSIKKGDDDLSSDSDTPGGGKDDHITFEDTTDEGSL